MKKLIAKVVFWSFTVIAVAAISGLWAWGFWYWLTHRVYEFSAHGTILVFAPIIFGLVYLFVWSMDARK